MKTLSPIAALLARYIHLIALALFAGAGVAVLDDYGISSDEEPQREIGAAYYDYVLGDENAPMEIVALNRRYGVSVEIPLIAAERLLGLEDSRGVYLSRHLITHLLFLASGFFAWLLAYRLFGNRLIALLAMLVFLLHPRIYAHSFFNSKDPTFLAMFMAALYLIHRAFRRDSVWAFALCGAAVGALVNARAIGVMLIPAVLGALALDAVFAMRIGARTAAADERGRADSQSTRGGGRRGGRRRRRLQARRERARTAGTRRALGNAAAFSVASATALYAAWPLLWRDPLELADTLSTMARHPKPIPSLFRGDWISWPNAPWDYLPTWALITTPPAALILAALGTGFVVYLCAANRRGMLANSTARFGLLALACLILPAAAAIALNSNLYNGWRQFYFLHAPMCVLAAFGLRALAAIPNPSGRVRAFLPAAIPKSSVRAVAFALAAAGIVAAGVSMVRLHPNQHEYFNPLVNKSGVAERWEMAYWRMYKDALDKMVEMQPSGRIGVTLPVDRTMFTRNLLLVPQDDRNRFAADLQYASFRVVDGDGGEGAVWKREIYGVPLVSILDVRAESESLYRGAYDAASASEPTVSAGGFNIYKDGGRLIWVKRQCSEYDTRGRFALSVFPVDRNDLPQAARDAGAERETLNFDYLAYGATLDGDCVIIRKLPDYRISHVAIGQWIPGEPGSLWSARIPFAGYYDRFRAALSSISGAPPAVRADFDVYLDDGTLTWVKRQCSEYDTRGRFALSAYPIDLADLPQSARDEGLERERLNFDFAEYGAIFGGDCVIIRELPDYPISHVAVGQWIPGDPGALWSADIEFDG